jgi:hypothetical protein
MLSADLFAEAPSQERVRVIGRATRAVCGANSVLANGMILVISLASQAMMISFGVEYH